MNSYLVLIVYESDILSVRVFGVDTDTSERAIREVHEYVKRTDPDYKKLLSIKTEDIHEHFGMVESGLDHMKELFI